MFLLTLDREVRPAPEPITVPPAAPAPPPTRNRRIQLFAMDKPDGAVVEAQANHGTDYAPDQPAENVEAPAAAPMVGQSDPSDESPPPESGMATGDDDNAERGVVGRIRAFFRGR